SKLRTRAEALLTLHNTDHAEWYETAVLHLVGVSAFLIAAAQNGLLDVFNETWGLDLKADLPSVKAIFDADREVLFGRPKRNEAGDLERNASGGVAMEKLGLKACLTVDNEAFPNPLIRLTSQCAAQMSTESKNMGAQAWQQVGRQLQWLSDPDLSDAVKKSTFDISRIAYDDISLFVGLPGGLEAEKNAPLQRLIIALVAEAMNEKFKANGEGGKTVLTVLDDFAMLGNLSRVLGTANLGALYKTGMICWFILQNLDQLFDIYGPEAAGAILAECPIKSMMALEGERDLKFLSDRCGTNRLTGKPYLMPHEIREIIRKPDNELPRRKIVMLPDMPDTFIIKPNTPAWKQ
ncbi:MAG: type IV secretory system conjugative DNA transfer family protein, partial [Pseudomonadota bacterium]